MIKLNNSDYKKVINAINDMQFAFQKNIFMDLNSDTILDYSDQFDETQMSLRSLYINYYKSAKHQTLTNDSAEAVMYNIWDMMTQLNGCDKHDTYLKPHLGLCKAWLLMAKYANTNIEHHFNKDLDAKVSGLSFKHFVHIYSRDIKQMQNELKYYWSVVRDYGWGRVKFDNSPLDKSVTVDKPKNRRKLGEEN